MESIASAFAQDTELQPGWRTCRELVALVGEMDLSPRLSPFTYLTVYAHIFSTKNCGHREWEGLCPFLPNLRKKRYILIP